MDSDLIKTVNKLQDTFHNLGGELDMPQLVVVGSQSAGKSSVLETIVGKDFLPRGSGIVTRRPLVLQLIHTPAPTSSDSPTEWAQFLHLDKRFTDFNEIRKEIEQETFRVAGQNKGISKLPISLRIYSPNVLDLTLVDLPGLTKIPVGDQPSDIEKQIRNLVLEYISNPNSVILAVSPANVDLANSESLKLARSVDPQGRRTIGVLTKLDLMDAGTNALDILTGRVYPLKLGFIGVVNRSQQDINSSKPMEDALKSEQEFFEHHPAYRTIAHKNGTRYLAKTLNHVLMNHIREKLPDMKARLNTLITQAESQLVSFGESSITGQVNQSALILRLMTQFARDFISSIDGTSLSSSANTKELSGGARIYYIFNDVFGSALSSIDATAGLGDGDIRTVIRNSTGPRPSLFVPEVAFELLVKPQIRRLEAPSLRCVEMVYEELVKICHACTSPELERFPKLHAQLVEVVSELLRERLGPTSEYTKSLIDIQSAYINTNHPSFVAGSGAGSALVGQQGKPRPEPPTANGVIPGTHHDDKATSDDASSEDDDDDEPNGKDIFPPAKDRSVSNTLHDRSSRSTGRASTGTTPVNVTVNVKRSSSKHAPQRPHSALAGGVGGVAGGSPPSSGSGSAKETFLNYFFGQNGPGHQHQGTETSMMGSMSISDKKSNPAYDMKSLGRHIEAFPPSSPLPHQTHFNPTQTHISTLTPNPAPNPTHALTPRESLETSLIRTLITSYFSLTRQTILDLVPKAIMHLLVNYTSEHVQNRLVEVLYKPERFGEMLDEDEELVKERERVTGLVEAYREAFRVLGEVGVGGSVGRV